MKITHLYLLARLAYNPTTGEFVWRERKDDSPRSRSWNRLFAGRVAGGERIDGYWRIRIDQRAYDAHRLAWFYVHGTWPEITDHIDGDRKNNAIDNLRSVGFLENAKNRSISKTNKSGAAGVYKDHRNGRYKAKIGVDGKEVYLGMYSTLEGAVERRRQAEIEYGFHENHGRPNTLSRAGN